MLSIYTNRPHFWSICGGGGVLFALSLSLWLSSFLSPLFPSYSLSLFFSLRYLPLHIFLANLQQGGSSVSLVLLQVSSC